MSGHRGHGKRAGQTRARRFWFAWAFLFAMTLPLHCVAMGGSKVLVLTSHESPVARLLVQSLQIDGVVGAHGRRERVDVDVRVLGGQQAEEDLVRGLLPTMSRYRAVLATTMALARAMQAADDTTPIVFNGGADPVSMCLVDSLSRPGRNATGYVRFLPNDTSKMMELLVDGFPSVRRIYYVVDADNVYPASCNPQEAEDDADSTPCSAGIHEPDRYLRRRADTRSVLDYANRRGLDLRFVLICGLSDFPLLASLDTERTDVGLVVPWQYTFDLNAEALIRRVAQTRHPAIYEQQRLARLGGLMSIEPVRDASDERIPVDMLLQILAGRSPSTLPVQVPRGFRLSVNAAAAAAQGLQPSLKLLRRADEVILSNER